MAAAISATGTWSGLSDRANPSEESEANVIQKYRGPSLDYPANVGLDANGYQEVTQFLNLMATGYEITFGAALERLKAILVSMRQTPEPSIRRVYP